MIGTLFLFLATIIWIIWQFAKEKNDIYNMNEREKLVQQFMDKYCDKDLEKSLRKYVDKYLIQKDVLDNVNKTLKEYMENDGPLYVFEKQHSPPEGGWWRLVDEGFPSRYLDVSTNKDVMATLLLETHGKITERRARGLTGYIAQKHDGVTNNTIREWIITPPWISGNYVKWSDKNYPPIRRKSTN